MFVTTVTHCLTNYPVLATPRQCFILRSPLSEEEMAILKPLPDLEDPKLDPFTQDITAHDGEFL